MDPIRIQFFCKLVAEGKHTFACTIPNCASIVLDPKARVRTVDFYRHIHVHHCDVYNALDDSMFVSSNFEVLNYLKKNPPAKINESRIESAWQVKYNERKKKYFPVRFTLLLLL